MTQLQLTQALDRLVSQGGVAIAAIDGPCATGKSTLGAQLSSLYSCPLVHMDDFFLPPHRKTADRLVQPGGNVDYERVRDQVLAPLSQGLEARYRPYRCHDGSLGDEVCLTPTGLVVVEGVYSLHPALRAFYRLAVYLEAPWPLRRQRLLQRGGPPLLARFEREWIPMEERYFYTCQVQKACQFNVSCAGL